MSATKLIENAIRDIGRTPLYALQAVLYLSDETFAEFVTEQSQFIESANIETIYGYPFVRDNSYKVPKLILHSAFGSSSNPLPFDELRQKAPSEKPSTRSGGTR